MANASAKKVAVANAAALNTLHKLSTSIVTSVLLILWFRGRPVLRTIVLCLPAAFVEYFLEQSCRPVYQGEKLVRAGADFEQKGLTEYLRDLIYITWICAGLSVVVGNKAWYLYWIIPIFVLFKIFLLLNYGRKMLSGGSRPPAEAAPAKAAPTTNGEKLSKRQEKMQKLYAKRQPHQYAQAQQQYEQKKAKAEAQAREGSN